MLSLAKSDTAVIPMTKPTIAEIARAVPQGAALQMAESKLAALRGRREAVGVELNCAYEAQRDLRQPRPKTSISDLEAEKAALDSSIKEARRVAAELRLARSRKVAAALAEQRLDAARRLIAATDELAKAFRELIEACEEIRRAGDTDQPQFYQPAVGHIFNHAQSIVRAAE